MGANEQYGRDALAKMSSPHMVRRNLISAALLITSYETLRESITKKPLGFFSHEWVDGQIREDDNYRRKVRSLHKDRLEASCIWFQSIGALDEHDLGVIRACRQHRNDVVHELLKYLVFPDAQICVDLIDEIVRIEQKIERWWMTEIEIPTNPDDDRRDVNTESARSLASLTFEIIRTVAHENDEEGKRAGA